MSEVTKVLHRKNYPAIDAASPEQSQAGRKVLITGGTAVIGRAVAEGFVTAGADVVAITSRSPEKATSVAKELEAAGKEHTKISHLYLYLLTGFTSDFKNPYLNIERFQAQGQKEGKVLIYISTNAIHFTEVYPNYMPVTSFRTATTRLLQDLAVITPVTETQILTVHPGFIFTPSNAAHGYTQETFPCDDKSLPGNFLVWASTKKAAFLHGRFVWTNWDVDELMAMKPRIEADKGFLKVGVQGIASQSFEMLLGGMNRSV